MEKKNKQRNRNISLSTKEEVLFENILFLGISICGLIAPSPPNGVEVPV